MTNMNTCLLRDGNVILPLHQYAPETLDKVARRLGFNFGLFNLLDTGIKIDLRWGNDARLHDNLVAKVQDWEEEDGEIRSDEGRRVP